MSIQSHKVVISRQWAIIIIAAFLFSTACILVAVAQGGFGSSAAGWPYFGNGAAAQAQTTASAAAEVIQALLTIQDYHDPVAWQRQLDALSTVEGRTVWQQMLDQGFWTGIENHRITTREVVFTEIREVSPITAGGRPGVRVRLAGVLRGQKDGGPFESRFAYQVLMVQDTAGTWKFAYLDPTPQGGK